MGFRLIQLPLSPITAYPCLLFANIAETMPRTSLLVLMAVACFLAVAVGVTDAVALSGDQNCDPSSECVYDYTQPSASRRWKYNFSSLCSGTDYVFHNATKGYVVVDDVHAACISR